MKTRQARPYRQPAVLQQVIRSFRHLLSAVTQWSQTISLRRRENQMRLCETLSLGDRRFLAVVLVEQQKFLVGGAPNSVALLAKLPSQGQMARRDDEVHLL
jgi:flagellar biogenesis protein FliO